MVDDCIVGVDSDGESLPDMDLGDDVELGNVQFDEEADFIPILGDDSEDQEDELYEDADEELGCTTVPPPPPPAEPLFSPGMADARMQQQEQPPYMPRWPASSAPQNGYVMDMASLSPLEEAPAQCSAPVPAKKILLLFDLNGVLTDHTPPNPSGRRKHVIRPHIEELLKLLPHFQVGVYSSATMKTVNQAISMIVNGLKRKRPGLDLPHPLFEPILCRDHCMPDHNYKKRGGKEWDTCKPLNMHGLDLATTVLIDNDHYKAVEGEESSMLLVPDWLKDAASDEDFPLLVDLLLTYLKGAVDVRLRLHQISRMLLEMRVARHGPGAQPRNMPVLPHLAGLPTPVAPALPDGVDSATEDAAAAMDGSWRQGAGAQGAVPDIAAGWGSAAAGPSRAVPQLVVDMRMLGPTSAVPVVDLRHLGAGPNGGAGVGSIDSFSAPAAPAAQEGVVAMEAALSAEEAAAAHARNLAAAAAVLAAEQRPRTASAMQLRQYVQKAQKHSRGLAEAGDAAFSVVQRAMRGAQGLLDAMAAEGRVIKAGSRYQLAGEGPSPATLQQALFSGDADRAAQLLLLDALHTLTSGPGVSIEEVQVAMQGLEPDAVALLQGIGLANALTAASSCRPQHVVRFCTGVDGQASEGLIVYRCCADPDPAALRAALQAIGPVVVAAQPPAAQGQSAETAPSPDAVPGSASMPSTSAHAPPMPSSTSAAAAQPCSRKAPLFVTNAMVPPKWRSTPAAPAAVPDNPANGTLPLESLAPAPTGTDPSACPAPGGTSGATGVAQALAALTNMPAAHGQHNTAANGDDGAAPRAKRARVHDAGSEDEPCDADGLLDQLYAEDEMGHLGLETDVEGGMGGQEEDDDVEQALRAHVGNAQMQPLQMAGQAVFEERPTAGQQRLYPPTAAGARGTQQQMQLRRASGASSSSAMQQQPDPFSSLHHEVAAFARQCAPTAEEADAVRMAVSSIDHCVRGLWPQARTVLFGSQASGFALPGSDLDIVVLGMDVELTRPAEGYDRADRSTLQDMLHELKAALTRRGLVGKAMVIGARVPIIKTELTEKATGSIRLPVDISVGVSNGAAAVSYLCRQVDALPALRPLVLVAKALLKEKGLNEVFKGGLSSYSLISMVMAHLQCEGLQAAPADAAAGSGLQHLMDHEALGNYLSSLAHRPLGDMDLGHLAAGFFERFGSLFNYTNEAVSVRHGGVVLKPHVWQQAGRPFLLAVEDPQQGNRDIGSGSFNIKDVQSAYNDAAKWLKQAVRERYPGHGRPGQLSDELPLLSRLLNLDAALGRGPKGVKARKTMERVIKEKEARERRAMNKAEGKLSKRAGGMVQQGVHGAGMLAWPPQQQYQQQQQFQLHQQAQQQYQQPAMLQHSQFLLQQHQQILQHHQQQLTRQQQQQQQQQRPSPPEQTRKQTRAALWQQNQMQLAANAAALLRGSKGDKGRRKVKQRAGNPALHQVFGGGVHKKAHAPGSPSHSSSRNSKGGSGKGGSGKGGGGRGWSHQE